ncbi:MAG: DUF459 domain-containing protein, partial [Thermoleophilaceae bacterium]
MEPRTTPAGRVLGVIAIALLVATLLNSEAIVRAGESMERGATRDVVLSIARPLDDVAGAIGLHLPREGLDLAFGQEDKTAEGTDLEEGSAAILRRDGQRARERSFAQPTPEEPVEVLVTGDSQATFIGQLLTDELPEDLFDVEVVPQNSTGLTNPQFFNWEIHAEQEIAARAPDAVVMVIGGNDGLNLIVDGQLYEWHEPQWEVEYARRAAVVMRELGSGGERPVYWVPPPTARNSEQNGIYETQNRAVESAAAAIPYARYVDIFNTINGGEYSDELRIDGERVLARQPDGIH